MIKKMKYLVFLLFLISCSKEKSLPSYYIIVYGNDDQAYIFPFPSFFSCEFHRLEILPINTKCKEIKNEQH
jgi:hypothetical protein